MTPSNEDTRFGAIDEAFFNAANDHAPVSERPVTLDMEAEEPDIEERRTDAAAGARLRARQARLTQAVAEIVATLAMVSGTAFGMHFVRGPAAPSPRAAATPTPTSQQATALSPSAPSLRSVTPTAVPSSAPVPAVEHRTSVTQHAKPAKPATSDSAARLRKALRRYRAAAGDRSTPGS